MGPGRGGGLGKGVPVRVHRIAKAGQTCSGLGRKLFVVLPCRAEAGDAGHVRKGGKGDSRRSLQHKTGPVLCCHVAKKGRGWRVS